MRTPKTRYAVDLVRNCDLGVGSNGWYGGEGKFRRKKASDYLWLPVITPDYCEFLCIPADYLWLPGNEQFFPSFWVILVFWVFLSLYQHHRHQKSNAALWKTGWISTPEKAIWLNPRMIACCRCRDRWQHGTANYRTIMIRHSHKKAQICIDWILYTQDSEFRNVGDGHQHTCIFTDNNSPLDLLFVWLVSLALRSILGMPMPVKAAFWRPFLHQLYTKKLSLSLPVFRSLPSFSGSWLRSY